MILSFNSVRATLGSKLLFLFILPFLLVQLLNGKKKKPVCLEQTLLFNLFLSF